ncbi:MAG: hypothetical protein ACO1QR_02005 [Chthoniobacteraceae bacterium]
MTPLLHNTAGEPEREMRSRRANVVEALTFACVILIVLWPICFGLGVLGDSGTVRNVAKWPLILAFVWVLFCSPFWHRDTADSLGLGNPLRLWRTVRTSVGFARWRLLAPAVLIFSVLFLASIAYWPDTAKMFKLGAEARAWPVMPGGEAKVFLFSTLMSGVVAFCLVRYDNLSTALRPVLIASAALLLYAVGGAWLNHGSAAFERIIPPRYPADVLAYALWGMTQQFLFTSYFSTRLRKGFAPGRKNSGTVARQWRSPAVLGGATSALAIAPPVWLAVRSLFGSEQAPLGMLAWFAVFAFPVGAVWMHFYRRDPRRMLVATLAGSFFGLIHIDSYGLVLVTFGLGTIFAYLFMEDRFRNLAVTGFAHGLLGSTFGKFFKTEAAGPLRISYRVGPWSVEEPAAHVLIIPLICLGIYLALLIWACRSGFFAPDDEAAPLPRKASEVNVLSPV